MDAKTPLSKNMDAKAEASVANDPTALSFFLHKEGVTYGPESATNLRALWDQGWVQPDDLIWKDGETEWVSAAAVFAASAAADDPSGGVEEQEDASLHDRFEQVSAVPVFEERTWPWSAFVIAILVHAALLFLAVEWLQLFPVKFDPYVVPPTQGPPLEVAMVPEEEPAPPPPVPPPDQAPPPPTLAPPPPPIPLPDLTPPPPPAPVEMPVPALPPMPPEPVVPIMPTPQNIASTPQPATPPPPHPLRPKVAAHPLPAAVPQEASNESDVAPQYLANPRPEYPFVAKQRHQEGTVLLLVTLNGAGVPTSVVVEQSSGYSVLDQAARKKVSSDWRFKPGSSSVVHVPVEFNLEQATE
jgi:protein TonB